MSWLRCPPICPPFVRDLQIMFGTLHFLGGVHKLLEITNLVDLYCILHFIVSHTWWWRGVGTPKYHRKKKWGTETTTQKGQVIYQRSLIYSVLLAAASTAGTTYIMKLSVFWCCRIRSTKLGSDSVISSHSSTLLLLLLPAAANWTQHYHHTGCP